MRFDGTLAKWDENRGFGFITPAQGGPEVFVHISSFARDGRRPRLHEILSFEIELDRKQQKCAVSIRRPSLSQPSLPGLAHSRPHHDEKSALFKWLALALVIAVGAYAYTQYAKRVSIYSTVDRGESLLRPATRVQQPVLTSYRCDGRQHCSQMNSCEEATFFLKNCPGVKMDGDHDGVACEEQWCTTSFAR